VPWYRRCWLDSAALPLNPAALQKLVDAATQQTGALKSFAETRVRSWASVERRSQMLPSLLGNQDQNAVAGAIGKFMGMGQGATGPLFGMLGQSRRWQVRSWGTPQDSDRVGVTRTLRSSYIHNALGRMFGAAVCVYASKVARKELKTMTRFSNHARSFGLGNRGPVNPGLNAQLPDGGFTTRYEIIRLRSKKSWPRSAIPKTHTTRHGKSTLQSDARGLVGWGPVAAPQG
jgi:hypothetical protein